MLDNYEAMSTGDGCECCAPPPAVRRPKRFKAMALEDIQCLSCGKVLYRHAGAGL
jgi:hypothetical protein